ncbi:flagellar motor protein MotB [bacterium]|nr:flagellar motor protein MotB [bacterium]
MAKKKKHEEHENLERWLVSYADFMTLLFATFVVLYALSQTDVNEFKKLEETIRLAFSRNSLLQGQEGVLTGTENPSLLDNVGMAGEPNPLMLEYISTKYEENAYSEIKDEIDGFKLDGVKTIIDNKGLTIRLPENILYFDSNSARINPQARKVLLEVGQSIFSRFQIHLIRVEGHTDSLPTGPRSQYPSNWELSGARSSAVINFFLENFAMDPKNFVSIGYADTVPIDVKNPASSKNRRIEIVVLRNRNKAMQNNDILTLLEKKSKTKNIKSNYAKKDASNIIENKELTSPAINNPTKESIEIKNDLENENYRLYNEKAKSKYAPSFMKK